MGLSQKIWSVKYILNKVFFSSNQIKLIGFSNIFFSFVIPSIPNDAGVNHGSIVAEYLQKLNRDVPNLTEESDFFFRGIPPKGTTPSRFTKQPIGDTLLKQVPEFIATKVGLPNPSQYTSHSFRRTTATLAAEANVSADSMTVSNKQSFGERRSKR